MEVPIPRKAPRAVEPPPGTCPHCEGRGWRLRADGGAGTAVPCDCRKQRRTDELLALAEIPERYRGCRLSNFQTTSEVESQRDALLGALRLCKLYADAFFDPETRAPSTLGLLFIGPAGVGKTHLATALLRELITRYGVRGCFADFTHLLHRLQSTFDGTSRSNRREIMDPVERADVLVLDELGAQKPSDWVMEVLYHIVNTRYTRRLPTLFTTNFPLTAAEAGKGRGETLESRITAPLVSRLYEMAQPVRLEVHDFRREVKVHQHQLGR